MFNSLNSFLFLILTTPLLCQNPLPYEHPIKYHPKSYISKFTNRPPIIDGILHDSCWDLVSWTAPFVDIEGENQPQPRFETRVKMLWDEEYFYIAAYLEEPHLWSTLTQRDAIMFHENNFEVFIDPDGDTHNYYEFEMNARNVFWDLFLLKPYRDIDAPVVFNDWNMLNFRSAVKLQGTLNNSSDIDTGWTIELAFPWTSISEISRRKAHPIAGDTWRVNFSRVEHMTEPVPGGYKKKKTPSGERIPENNWVWSPQGRINMHEPESWGYVRFAGNTQMKESDLYDENEKIKWGLRQLYFQQREFYENHHRFATISQISIPSVDLKDYTFNPKLDTSEFGYFMSAGDYENTGYWVIRNDGRIWHAKKR